MKAATIYSVVLMISAFGATSCAQAADTHYYDCNDRGVGVTYAISPDEVLEGGAPTSATNISIGERYISWDEIVLSARFHHVIDRVNKTITYDEWNLAKNEHTGHETGTCTGG